MRSLVVLMPVRASRPLLLAALLLLAPIRSQAADARAAPTPAAPPPSVAPPAAGSPATTASVTAPGKTKTKAKAPKKPKNPPVTLFTVNHKETFALRLRDAQGRPI